MSDPELVTQEEETAKEISLEDLEEGTDFTELFKATGTSKLSFGHNGKRWSFTYKHMTWQEHFELMQRYWITKTVIDDESGKSVEEPFFDSARYYEDAFMLAIIEGPGKQGVTRQMLRQLDSEIIQKLVNCVPSPSLTSQLVEIKKV